jgi:hypothetical protein
MAQRQHPDARLAFVDRQQGTSLNVLSGRFECFRDGDVLGLEVGVLAQDLVARATCGDEPDDGSDCDPHSADARLSAHYSGVTSDADQLSHVDGSSEAQHPIVDDSAHLAN